MNESTFTFQVDAALKEQFSAAVEASNLNGEQVLAELMRDFVARQNESAQYDAWVRREVQHGLDAANAGDSFSSDEVEAEAAAWRDAMRAP